MSNGSGNGGPPPARKAHVIRITPSGSGGGGARRVGKSARSIFLDVLRIDQTVFTFGGMPDGSRGQNVDYYFKWGDFSGQPPGANRIYDSKTIYNPQDGSQSVTLQVLRQLGIVDRQGLPTGVRGQGVKVIFNNTPSNQLRKFTPARIVNNDLGGLDMSSPVDWTHVYLPALIDGHQDPHQYLDVEIPDSFLLAFNPLDDRMGGKNQGVNYVLNSNPIENLFAPAPSGASLVRIDPLEVIVNVGWEESGHGAGPPPGWSVQVFWSSVMYNYLQDAGSGAPVQYGPPFIDSYPTLGEAIAAGHAALADDNFWHNLDLGTVVGMARPTDVGTLWSAYPAEWWGWADHSYVGRLLGLGGDYAPPPTGYPGGYGASIIEPLGTYYREVVPGEGIGASLVYVYAPGIDPSPGA